MKKFLTLVLALLMIAGSVVTASAAFDDVAADYVYATAIEELQTNKVIAGKTATTFGPEEKVTRWQMALFMARATTGIVDNAEWNEGSSIFTDCTEYLGAIQYCYANAIIKGVTATEFAPNANIKFKDAIIMAVRALGYERYASDDLRERFESYSGADYWVPFYQLAKDLELLENLEKVGVNNELTRAETAQLIYNMLYTVVSDTNGERNGQFYTLNDVVFNGKKIFYADSIVEAYVAETPAQDLFGKNLIEEDDEFVVICYEWYNSADEKLKREFIKVDFDVLADNGFDVENIEDYFGAYVELVNCDVDKKGNIDPDTFQKIINIETNTSVIIPSTEVTLHKGENRIKVDGQTLVLTDKDTYEDIELFWYDTSAAKDGSYKVKDADLYKDYADKYYDLKLYDTDLDGYYDIGFILPYGVTVYDTPFSDGEERRGFMENWVDVEYDETPDEDDVFVYTFDPVVGAVSVKAVLVPEEGKITGFSEVETEDYKEDKLTIPYVKIDGEKIPVAAIADDEQSTDSVFEDIFTGDINAGDIETLTTAELAEAAEEDHMDKLVEYYLFDGKIIAFGDDVRVAPSYAIVRDFTDYELGSHVVMDANIDGIDQEINVIKVRRYKYDASGNIVEDDEGNPVYDKTVKVADLGYGKLAKLLDNCFGIYAYSVDEDGNYTIKEQALEYKLGDFAADPTDLMFTRDGETAGTTKKLDDAEQQEMYPNERSRMLRISSATKIFVIDGEDFDEVKVKVAKNFYVYGTDAKTMFFADKIGYGKADEGHGIASIIYFDVTEKDNTDDYDFVEYANYTLVFVPTDVATSDYDYAESFGLELDDEDVMVRSYETAEGYAYTLAGAFEEVETLYKVKGYTNSDDSDSGKILEAGVYAINEQNIIVDHVALADIADDYNGKLESTNVNKTYSLNLKRGFADATFTFDILQLTSTKINLYENNYIHIEGYAKDNGFKIQAVKFYDFKVTEDDGVVEVSYTHRSGDKLLTYLDKNYLNADQDNDLETATVLVIPANSRSNGQTNAYDGGIFNGVILNNLINDIND